jgi:hypothetical protein
MFKSTFSAALLTLAFMPSLAIAEKMAFRQAWTGGNCSTCVWVAAEGEITQETPADFERYVAEFGPVRALVINSLGGDLMAGMALGQILRRQGITTVVGATVTGKYPDAPKISQIEEGYCYSACSYAFFGGVDRHVNAGELGVHQFYATSGSDISSSNTQSVVGVILNYLKEMEVSDEVLVSASFTTPDEIYIYSDQELTRFNIDNTSRADDGGWFYWLLGPDAPDDTSTAFDPHWTLAPYLGGLMLAGGVEVGGRRSISVTVFCRNGGAPANLLIQEGGEIRNYPDSINMKNPLITVGDMVYQLNQKDIDFQGMNKGVAMISLNLPIDILLSGADQYLEFSPDLPQVYYPLLHVRFRMPSENLVASVLRNCIEVN